MLTALLIACTPPPQTDSSTADENTDSGGDVTLPEGMAPLATVTDTTCPDLSSTGMITFTSLELERTAYVWFPEEKPANMPVVFIYHALGGTARQLNNYFDLKNWAQENNAIVVVPQSHSSNPFEWGFLNVADGAEDLALFDDLRTCLVNDLSADPARFSANGMSAGGLWTTFLSIHRGDTLAAVMPFSGGTGSVVSYETPAYAFPTLLAYGGETDTYNAGTAYVDFMDATLDFAESLAADGHFVVACNHNAGHTYPPTAMDLTRDWLVPHTFGEASPYANGDLSAFPEYCFVY